MGLLRENGAPKLALEKFAQHTPALGLCQWFHFEDHRLADAVAWMRRLDVRHLRTGLSWADSFRPKALDWFEIKEVRGTVVEGKVGEYQVTLDVGFRYLTDEEMRAWVHR